MTLLNIDNTALIDGQNLYSGTRDSGWSIDHLRFMVYLREKYGIKNAYYFLGYRSEKELRLYSNLESAGFILLFKSHASTQLGTKKGNVDSDIIFEIMRKMIEGEVFNKVFIVSGDGDYKKLVDYLIYKNKFGKFYFRIRSMHHLCIINWVQNILITLRMLILKQK